MNLQNLFQSKKFKWLIGIIGSLIILLLVFQLGMFVGFRKAGFSYRWGDNYHRAFGGPKGGFLDDFQGRDFINGHGTAGTIAKIESSSLIIKDQGSVEKIINIANDTSIKQGMADKKLSDLKVDDRVVVIGSPKNDGSIDAKIVRVFDANSPAPMPPGPLPWLK